MNYYNTRTLLFKNGAWVKNPGDFTYPFKYADGGPIHTVKGERIYEHIKWRHNKNFECFMRAGMPNIYIPSYVRAKPLKFLWYRILWILGVKSYCGALTEAGVYEKDDITVYIFSDRLHRIYVSFYKDNTDTYVLFAENDCCRSILTSLLDNGYSDEVEQSIATEIFNWCYENALTWVSDDLGDNFDDSEELLDKLRDIFGKKDNENE